MRGRFGELLDVSGIAFFRQKTYHRDEHWFDCYQSPTAQTGKGVVFFLRLYVGNRQAIRNNLLVPILVWKAWLFVEGKRDSLSGNLSFNQEEALSFSLHYLSYHLEKLDQ